MSEPDADFYVVAEQLRNVLAFSRSCRQQAVGVNKEMWHKFVQQDVARLNAHLASRHTQTTITPHKEIASDSLHDSEVSGRKVVMSSVYGELHGNQVNE